MNEIEEMKIKTEQEEDHGCYETNHEHLEIIIKLEDESIGYPDDEIFEPLKNHESELFKSSSRNVNVNDVTSPKETNPQYYEITIKLEDESKPKDGKDQSAQLMDILENQNSVNINDGTNCFEQFSPIEEINSQIGEEITIKFEDELQNFQSNENESLHEIIKAFECQECGESFATKRNLVMHQVTVHEGINPFECQECGKSFGKKSNLTLHQLTVHQGIKAFTCEESGKSFGQKANLTSHQRTVHGGVKPFQCQECGKTFGQKANLTSHQKTVHQGIKAFKCQECSKCFAEKSFRRKTTLTSHQKTVHESVKAFKCQECGNCFFTEINLKRHQKTVHQGVKAFKCQECSKCFAEKKNLTSH
eukprot:TCONS_00044990-protein